MNFIVGLISLVMGVCAVGVGLHFEFGTESGRGFGAPAGKVRRLNGIHLNGLVLCGLAVLISGVVFLLDAIGGVMDFDTAAYFEFSLLPMLVLGIAGLIRGVLPAKLVGPKWLREEIKKGHIKDNPGF